MFASLLSMFGSSGGGGGGSGGLSGSSSASSEATGKIKSSESKYSTGNITVGGGISNTTLMVAAVVLGVIFIILKRK